MFILISLKPTIQWSKLKERQVYFRNSNTNTLHTNMTAPQFCTKQQWRLPIRARDKDRITYLRLVHVTETELKTLLVLLNTSFIFYRGGAYLITCGNQRSFWWCCSSRYTWLIMKQYFIYMYIYTSTDHFKSIDFVNFLVAQFKVPENDRFSFVATRSVLSDTGLYFASMKFW